MRGERNIAAVRSQAGVSLMLASVWKLQRCGLRSTAYNVRLRQACATEGAHPQHAAQHLAWKLESVVLMLEERHANRCEGKHARRKEGSRSVKLSMLW